MIKNLINRMGILNLLPMRFPKNPKIKVNVSISGEAKDVLPDIARLSPKNCDSLISIEITVKSDQGSWFESYELPILNSSNTIPQEKALEGLLKQARISQQQYDETMKTIQSVRNCANEVGYKSDRYEHKTLNS